ncbi:hypothetical protein COT72_01230 [archaeon CG10_big_fil_rev_8_21_14_0_10_43_11]|nr:MAG: hypothetical protein COT72_01230 [archaeon CG10_big_fil_rev_8_21_14_0_10_43_11]
MEVRIVSKKPKTKAPIIIEGFPGVGLVGSIASKYLTQKLDAKQIGHIESPHLPPLSFIQDGDVYNPIRIYDVPSKGWVIISSEFPVPATLIHDVGEAIVKWAKEINASRIVCLEGINSPNIAEEPRVFGIDANIKTKLPSGLEPVKTGYILGVSAAIMLACKYKKIKALCLMAESHSNYPDGLAAVALIKKLGSLFKVNVDVKPLVAEAEEFEKKIKDLIGKAKEVKHESDESRNMYG